MILYLIKRIIDNDDIAIHIHNIYIILNSSSNLNLITSKFINDEFYMNLIINKIHINNYNDFIYIKKLFNDNDIIINKLIKKNPSIIKYLDYKYKNNPSIIKDICFYNSYYFKFASKNLKNDINFIINLLDINIFIYFFIDDDLKKHKDIIIKIKKTYPTLLNLI